MKSNLSFLETLNNNTINKKAEQHPFHLVDPSPWPLFTGVFLIMTVLFTIFFMHDDIYTYPCSHEYYFYAAGLLCFFVTVILWFNDIIIEATFQGNHTRKVQYGLQIGVVLFIVSEVLFFFAFFWAFFHNSVSPSIWIGNIWPPEGVEVLLPWGLPFLNTMILLASGVSVTWAHRAMINKPFTSRQDVILGLLVTISYGLVFTLIQRYEYIHADFYINDSVYASTFYAITGLHGIHVLIGSIFILVCLLRQISYHFTFEHHFGFEAAIWYWHFVDVVWLFLFVAVYWWGGA